MKKTTVTIKRGSVEVTVRPEVNHTAGQQYEHFLITYYDETGKRQRKKRSSFEDAKKLAEETATRISRQEAYALTITGSERDVYRSAMSIVAPAEITLLEAVQQWDAARKRLPEGITLLDAVEDYAKRHAAVAEEITVKEMVDRYNAQQEKKGMAHETRRKRKQRSERFAKSFGTMPVHTITATMLAAYLDGAGKAAHTKTSHAKLLSSLFNYAVRQKHASAELLAELEAARHGLPKIKRGAVKGLVYSPAEMREILEAVRPELLPEVILQCFCGIRRQEIISPEKKPLDWSQIDLARGHVDLDHDQAKAEQRRLAPIPENAVAWLRDHAKRKGRVAHFDDPGKLPGAVAKDVNAARTAAGKEPGFTWKMNGLRHSFISYRCALLRDIPRVAIEAGNSVDQIHATYREVRTHDEAVEYFEIKPTSPANLVVMQAA